MLIKTSSQELISLRVQYLGDADPFGILSMFPIPTRAPSYSFITTEPLATQLASVLRLLNAPQPVREILHSFCHSYVSHSDDEDGKVEHYYRENGGMAGQPTLI